MSAEEAAKKQEKVASTFIFLSRIQQKSEPQRNFHLRFHATNCLQLDDGYLKMNVTGGKLHDSTVIVLANALRPKQSLKELAKS